MLSVDVIRKLLDDPSLTDDQVEDIRAAAHGLAELVFQAWRNGQQLDQKSTSEAATDSTPNRGGL